MIDINDLISEGRKLLQAERVPSNFETGEPESEALLNDIERHPHFFVLACLMDRQIRADRAWIIPWKIGKHIGSFDFANYAKITEAGIADLFSELKLHRFKVNTARSFYLGIKKIEADYEGDASLIWRGTPASAAVVRRFLEFDGAGIKIATMAANILARDFKVPMKDYSSIDISPDVQVRKFLEHNNLIRRDASREEIIYLARELCPDYPGVFDYLAWKWGRSQSRTKVEPRTVE